MTGMIGFIVALVSLVSAWLLGKSNGKQTTTTRIGGEIVIQKSKVETAETEKDLAVSAASIASSATDTEKVFADAQARLDEARKSDDTDTAIAIAQALAERAMKRINK